MREYRGRVFSDIVHEWEEDLSNFLRIPIIDWGKKHKVASGILNRIPSLHVIKDVVLSKDKKYLRYVMNALDDTPLFNHKSCIPVIIDFFVEHENIKKFINIYDKCEYVFITSRQAYDFLSKYKLPFKLFHFPLTLSDRYYRKSDEMFEKEYNLTLFGAQIYDKVLKGFLDQYCEAYPDFEYVYHEKDSNMYVTNKGRIVCDASTRDEYFKLLRATKVVIYSTPGIRGRETAHGYDQVTPKYLEYLAAQCQIITRYSINSDTEYYKLSEYSSNINSYSDFCNNLNLYLKQTVDRDRNLKFLYPHLTSKLPKLLDRIINNHE